jgi:hypothetical protein
MMKRTVTIFIIVFLLAALLPSAFCVAEDNKVQRYGELIDALESKLRGDDAYCTQEVLDDIQEAVALASEPAVQTEVGEAQCRRAAFYQEAYMLLADLAERIKDKSVQYADSDIRRYAYKEWENVISLYATTVANMREAETVDEMRGLRDRLFDAIETIPVYQDVYEQWTTTVDEVVNAKVVELVDKVNAYRKEKGLKEVHIGKFQVVFVEDCTEDFNAFVQAYLQDADALKAAFASAISATLSLDLYASKAEIETQWSGYSAQVSIAVPHISEQDIALEKAKTDAVDTLNKAIADSTFIASLSEMDRVVIMTFPELMKEELQDAATVEEVNFILTNYLALLEPEAYDLLEHEETNQKSKISNINIAIIVMGSISVLLFVAYFILRARNKSVKTDEQGAEDMLRELQVFAATHQDGAQPAEGEVDAQESQTPTDQPIQAPTADAETASEQAVERVAEDVEQEVERADVPATGETGEDQA